MDDPEPEWHRQAAAVNLVSLSDGVTPGRQGNGVEGWDNNNHIIYKINMYKYIYVCVRTGSSKICNRTQKPPTINANGFFGGFVASLFANFKCYM